MIVIVAVSIIIACTHHHEKYDGSHLKVFISVITGLSLFISMLIYYNLATIQQDGKTDNTHKKFHKLKDQMSTNMTDDIINYNQKIPYFVKSISPLVVYHTVIDLDPVNNETIILKNTLAHRIFNFFEKYITIKHILKDRQESIISVFLQRANSRELYDIWLVQRLNFSKKTQKLADLLFKYGLPITEQTAEKYMAVTDELMMDKEFKAL